MMDRKARVSRCAAKARAAARLAGLLEAMLDLAV
jgi:hypothetical protein